MNPTVNKVSSVAVMGPDIDSSLVRSLTEGDKILVEMNGIRVQSTHPCPLVAEEPWLVVSNTPVALTLTHSQVIEPLVLPYTAMLELAPTQPAVFKIEDIGIADGPIYVLLQFIAFRHDSNKVDKVFPLAWDSAFFMEFMAHPSVRQESVERIVDTLATFKPTNWTYMGVLRFALRSQVRVKVINAFRTRDWDIISQQSDETLAKIAQELSWVPHCVAANRQDVRDFDTTCQTKLPKGFEKSTGDK